MNNETGNKKILVRLGKDKESQFEVPIPSSDDVVLKGGPPRAILKIAADASSELIRSEFPLNDIDAMVRISKPEAIHEAMKLGADREGVEGVVDPLSADNLFNRDITLNSCALTAQGLIFIDEAFRDAATGQAVPLDSDRGHFGRNNFFHEGIMLTQPRCMFRLIKFLAEEKASYVELHPRNFNIDVGVYLLTLGRKFATKTDAPLLFARTFDILQQIGQVRPQENNFFDVLTRVHQEHPYFDVSSSKLSRIEIAEWLSRKVDKFIVRSFRNLERIQSSPTIPVIEGDDRIVIIKLSPHADQPMRKSTHEAMYKRFLIECEERTRKYLDENQDTRSNR